MKKSVLYYALSAVLFCLSFAQTACKKDSTTTITLPVVQTFNIISNVTSTTAQCGGYITNFNYISVTANGVCWSATNAEPTISDSNTSETVAALYSSTLTGLTAGTTYHVRAYATNTGGTVYGSVLTFTTPVTTAASTAAVSTFAGNGTAGLVNGAAAMAQFNNPAGITIDAAGNIYVADATNNAIRKITPAGAVSTLAGGGDAGLTDGTGTEAQFYSPQGLAADAAGNIYVADLGNNAIRKITPAGTVTTLAGSGIAGYTDDTGAKAQFKAPRGVAVDASGNVYVADKDNNRIRKITAAGVVTTVAGSGVAGYLAGTGTAAAFNQPTGITVDASGNLYVSDIGNYAIRQISTAGEVTTLAGGAYDYTQIGLPTGVTSDSAGNLYITDQAGRILKITTQKVLYTLAGSSANGLLNGTGTDASFYLPQTTAVDASGNLYVADAGNQVIRKIIFSK